MTGRGRRCRNRIADAVVVIVVVVDIVDGVVFIVDGVVVGVVVVGAESVGCGCQMPRNHINRVT